MKNFKTFTAASEFYKISLTLNLSGHLREQLHRAASSIALNLAEGRGRQSIKDQLRFFSIAMGSLRECQAILRLADLENTQAWESLDKVGAHLYRLIN